MYHTQLKFATALLAAAAILAPAVLPGAPAAARTETRTPAKPQKITFEGKADKPGAVYREGEPITLSCRMLLDGKQIPGKFTRYTIYVDGNRVDSKVLPSEQTFTVTGKLDRPGWYYVIGTALDENQKPVMIPNDPWKNAYSGGVGAMVAPEKIRSSGTEPADFDEFWKSQRAALDKVPVRATREEVSVPQNLQGKVVCYDVKVDCAGAKPVSGYLAMPAKAAPKSLPAVVSYHGAGVRSANKPLRYATKAICLDVNAHGIENGKPSDFYQKLNKESLSDYRRRGRENRDEFYFKEMYLRVMRALDYVKSLPEWDGKTLIVHGGSQGGGQSLVAAALDPQVTLCVAGVPALGDHAGRLVGRQPGWPFLYSGKNGVPDNPAACKTAEYFDNNNFAKRIKCETFVSTGFVDTTCAPTSVYSAYNSIPAGVRKHIDTTPDKGHNAPIPSGYKRIEEIVMK